MSRFLNAFIAICLEIFELIYVVVLTLLLAWISFAHLSKIPLPGSLRWALPNDCLSILLAVDRFVMARILVFSALLCKRVHATTHINLVVEPVGKQVL